MELIAIVFNLILLVYVLLIGQLIYGFGKIKTFKFIQTTPKTTFSMIVPFRNEQKNLPKLLKSIAKLNYPKELFEVILVDDFSNDNSEKIFNQWRFENGLIQTTLLNNVRLSNSPKKDAITRATTIIKNEWIVTTDADCTVKKNWLLNLDNCIQQNNIEMIVGAVKYKTKNNWFHWFQQLDLMSLQGTTIGSFGINKPFMCNGANFAYTKRLFDQLDGFKGNNKIASGDDVFLLQKAIKNTPEKVHYLKTKANIVSTQPEDDLYKLFMQRVRWAGKATDYSNLYAKILAVVVLLMNMNIVIGSVLLMYGIINWALLLSLFIIKYTIDYALLFKTNSFLRSGKFLLPLASSVIYPFFSTIVGIYSLFGSFTWKDRKHSKITTPF